MDQWSRIRYFRQRGQHVPIKGSKYVHDQLKNSLTWPGHGPHGMVKSDMGWRAGATTGRPMNSILSVSLRNWNNMGGFLGKRRT